MDVHPELPIDEFLDEREVAGGATREQAHAIEEVSSQLHRLDPTGARWAGVVRLTYDMIYNGQATRRYKWSQLMKTEKTHFGTLFEINAQREFEFEGGDSTDFRITGHEVDAKWSQRDGGWMLPPEVFGKLALVATGSDDESRWSLGLVAVNDASRRSAANRDQKVQLSRHGRNSIHWLWRHAPLRPNVLLQLREDQLRAIFENRYGTQRTNQLFRIAVDRVVNRNIVATVSQQLDHQKRVRYAGGSRSALQPEGYIILSGMYHRHLAEALGLPQLRPDEYISTRVVPAEPSKGVKIDGTYWRKALPGEPVSAPAPLLPERGSQES